MQENMMEFPEGYVFPESSEVALQRVSDLSNYMMAQLPSLFELDTPPEDGSSEHVVGIPKGQLESVLKDFEEEFSYSTAHTASMLGVISVTLANAVRAVLDDAIETQRAFMEDEDGGDEEESANLGVMEVLWGELYVNFDSGSKISSVMHLSSLAFTALLNSVLWGDSSWDIVFEGLTEHVPGLADYFNGGLGFQAICAWTRVVKFRDLPAIKFHMEG